MRKKNVKKLNKLGIGNTTTHVQSDVVFQFFQDLGGSRGHR